MGAAAYRRGSIALSREIAIEQGTYREPCKPQPRPSDWGTKALARATDRARRIIAANAKFARVVSLETLIACVIDRERVGEETATAAARAAMEPVT
jgi:hypothetical protein